MTILISDKVDFRAKKSIRDRQGHYIIRPTHWEHIVILYVYAQNYRTTKYVKQKLKGEMDKSTTDQISRQEINKDVKEFNTTDQ